MEPAAPSNEWKEIENALQNVRDSWVLVSMALKDHVANMPSPQREEVADFVERQLARYSESSDRDNYD